ncbi:MAG: phytanoyl-CoA dioxygenase family protein, partial [Rubripirellula sp.]
SAPRGRLVGGRNLLSHWAGWRRLFDQPAVMRLVKQYVGSQAGVVRALFFDKPPGESWALSIHRDKTIAVESHCDPADPFSKPTRKAGVPHVEATHELLNQMLTLRFHLDPMCDENGPLTVISGSQDLDNEALQPDAETIHCGRGDVFAMRPLLLHGSKSAQATTAMHRRVVHFELAPSGELPRNYRWNEFQLIDPLGDVAGRPNSYQSGS